jgi:glucosyl-3-phosphoglycerate synthase
VDFSVVIPTRNEAPTVAGVIGHCLQAGAAEVLVVDSGSTDGTRDAARSAGASVHDSSDLFSELGTALGKGDALWRALPLTSSPVVAFVDGDLTVFDDLVPRLLAPLGSDGIEFSKANITRLDGSGHRRYGRVTQYTAKPLLAVLFPELADLDEPLSGQVAAPREALMRMSFEPDYGLEVGMLIDVCRHAGRDAIAHPDCGRIIHSEQSDQDLGAMAAVVARAVLARTGHHEADHPVRPPHLG